MTVNGPDQIRQMVNFILQEAHEKANEIRIKTEHDFNVDKQTIVHNAKVAIADEYKAKEREREVEARIARSTAVGDARVKKMKVRDDLLHQLVQQARDSVAAVVHTPAYPELVKKLIVQSLIKIEEEDVVVLCRPTDVPVCEAAVPGAVQMYKEILLKETGLAVNPKVRVNTDPKKALQDASGGVVVTACAGRIVCDNTLDARVGLVYDELLPTIREELWDKHMAKSK
jgi:V-type H+-transporting ATPase subunit E